MKNIRLFSKIAMFILCFFVSLGAFADNEVVMSLEKAYLTPGEQATLTIKLSTSVEVGSVGATINLPKGITFVQGKDWGDGSFDIDYSVTDLSKKSTIIFSTTNPSKACFAVAKTSNFKKDTNGDLLTFKVNVAKDFGIYGNVVLDEGLGALADVKEDGSFTVQEWKMDDTTTKVFNNNELTYPSVDDFSIEPGETKKISLNLTDEKHLISILSYNVQLPVGLSIDPDSYDVVEARIPHHEVIVDTKARIRIIPDGSTDDLDFFGTSGALVTFEVKADENFKEDGTIKFYDFLATTKADDNKNFSQYYAKDFTIKVKKGNTATGINNIESDFASKADGIYTISGLKVDKLVKGINIVVKDGKATKVVKK